MTVNVNNIVHKVVVEEDNVRVIAVAKQGPPGVAGEKGEPGDLDVAELEAIVDNGVSAHNAETVVHGVDTAALETQSGAQSKADGARISAEGYTDTHASATTNVHGIANVSELATQADLANIDVLPGGTTGALLVHGAADWQTLPAGTDTHVLTLASGEPTWAAPEGGGGLDPDGAETITGDWKFTRSHLKIGTDSPTTSEPMAIGVRSSATNPGALAIGVHARAWNRTIAIGTYAGGNASLQHSVAIGHYALQGNSGNPYTVIGIGYFAGQMNNGEVCLFLGSGAGRNNNRDDRLIIDSHRDGTANLIDPLIDGRFRSGTDADSFAYSKGVKINGHLETTDQLILHSPDGTRWAVTVDDNGDLSTTAATDAITP